MISYKDLYANIEKLINNSSISSYQVNKDTGVSYGNINAMRRGERGIDNLTLKNAEKRYNSQKQLEKENE